MRTLVAFLVGGKFPLGKIGLGRLRVRLEQVSDVLIFLFLQPVGILETESRHHLTDLATEFVICA